jgi:hypothetical protein
MALKEFSRNLGFADIEVERVLARTRTQGFLEEINRTVDWPPAQSLFPCSGCPTTWIHPQGVRKSYLGLVLKIVRIF